MKRRRFWIVFAAGALAAMLGMGWLTAHVIGLEHAECAARARAEQTERVRLALWRMDSWLNGQLAPEAARPFFDYDAYHSQSRAYTKALGQIEPGEVLTPSPLLAFRSELFPVHFQLAAGDVLTSPQVPVGNLRDLTEGEKGGAERIDASARRLAGLQRFLHYADLGTRLGRAAMLPMNCTPAAEATPWVAKEGDVRNRYSQSAAAKNSIPQQVGWTGIGLAEAAPGPLLPLWLDDAAGSGRQLVFARRVDLPDGTVYQGFAVDWDRLRTSLLEQVNDLFDANEVRLVRQDVPTIGSANRMLATVPARIEVPAPVVATAAWSATRTVLAAAWVALLLAIAAVGTTLGAALSFGDRRARFASAVTHELRSPLTTFRMYSEMLAEGMVTDPARRAEYLSTLCRESERLARLVENVLAYARIEDGRHRARHEPIDLGGLIERVRPVLERRAEESGFELRIEVRDPDAVVAVDPDAVEQVLFGLCDNACKYGGDGPRRAIELTAVRRGARAEIRVRDHGPGIPAAHRRRVFRPFDRGGRPAGESVVPGVGLGLALARGFAVALGGELTLDPSSTNGACFVLTLPLSRDA